MWGNFRRRSDSCPIAGSVQTEHTPCWKIQWDTPGVQHTVPFHGLWFGSSSQRGSRAQELHRTQVVSLFSSLAAVRQLRSKQVGKTVTVRKNLLQNFSWKTWQNVVHGLHSSRCTVCSVCIPPHIIAAPFFTSCLSWLPGL